ncbi:hypothetical protein B0H17DRAFT_1084654 [Mycena rosella]|uniref:Uncharacterized protein n=1 Tax=Mycena rosella TaxID=1033263 RepID=A0AAD7GAQ8_MYCRO|nr:hypothetical protein B0H17DRAFT_1084654 [Mycena rosella]
MSAHCPSSGSSPPPPFRDMPGTTEPTPLRVQVDSANTVPPPPYAAPVHSPHHSALLHPSRWFGRDPHLEDSEKISRLAAESTLPINEFLGHSCTHLLKADKALLKLSRAQLNAISVSYDRYETHELTVIGRRALLCTLARIEPKYHNEFTSAGLRFTGAGASADARMVAVHAIADLPQDKRTDATFLAAELHPTNVQARIDALSAMLHLDRSDASFVRSAHDVCIGCSDDALPLQVVNSLRSSHELVLRNHDGDRRVHYQPARQPEIDALANLWGHIPDGKQRMTLLTAFACVPADERELFADACRPLHYLAEYPKLVKLMASTPTTDRYARAQALTLPYDDPARISALRAQWPR